MAQQGTILVIGGAGTTGAEVIKGLSTIGARTRAFVREPSPALDLPGVEQVLGDLARPETLGPAFNGIRSAFLLTSPAENAAALQTTFVEAAESAGLPHLVKMSAYGASSTARSRLLRQHAAVERRIERSGIPYTFLRPAVFMQNLLAMRESIVSRGEFYQPQGDAPVNMVDVRDIAAVAVHTLTEPGHDGKAYDVTGPEAIPYDRVAEALSRTLGRPVHYVKVEPDAFRANLKQAGIPDWQADGLMELYDIWRNHGATEITGVVERVGKKKPYTIDEFASAYAAQFLGHTAAGR